MVSAVMRQPRSGPRKDVCRRAEMLRKVFIFEGSCKHSLAEFFVHLEHVDSVTLEDGAECSIAHDFALVRWVLHIVRLDVIPEKLDYLRARKFL